MSGFFSRKGFVGLLWAVPPIALMAFTTNHIFQEVRPAAPSELPPRVRVPIEVITADEKPKTIYVELDPQTIPEPSVLLLLPLSGGLLFRRQR